MKKLIPMLVSISLAGSYANASMLTVAHYNDKTYLVFAPQSLAHLVLALEDQTGKILGSFHRWETTLPKSDQLCFAMNAGMYHPDYKPVGLYIEQSEQRMPLNSEQGVGNFFMQPNGVLAWNQQEAIITTTQQWQQKSFKADYATQSGPMLVIDRQIMRKFIKDSDSRKIRNGVGIKDGQLYFVISQQRVNFYEFAEFFQQKLAVENALYLDGSISSIYAPAIKRYDRAYKLGPMLGYVQSKCD